MKARPMFYAIALAFAVWCLVTLGTGAAADDPPPTTTVEPTPDPAPPETVQGKTAAQWHRVAGRYLARVRSLHRAVRHDPETSNAIRVACIIYGNCGWLWRVAGCESGYWRFARNRYSDASGVFQFLPSTWAHTPFRTLSVFDPYANSLAAGWLAARGGRGQWVCR